MWAATETHEVDHFGLRISQARRHEKTCRAHALACNLAAARLLAELAGQCAARSLLTGKEVNR